MILSQSLTNKLSILILLIISFVLVNHNGIDNKPISNINQLVQNSILQHNNQIASNVAPENRDNFIPAIPLAYSLAGTALTNEYLKVQGNGDVGVGAHRVANQVKEGVSTAYEGIKSVDPHLRQSLENVEDAASFMVSKTITGSDAAVSSLFGTNSNQPVTETLAQVNQWYDNLPESHKGSVDLAGVLTSVVGSQYLGAAVRNIDTNKPNINLGGVGNNSPSISNGLEVYRQGTFADESVGWEGNYIKGKQWAVENPLTTPNYAEKYGLPAENSIKPDWVVGGTIEDSYITRPAPASHNNPLNTGKGTEIIPRNSNNVKIDWFHMPDK